MSGQDSSTLTKSLQVLEEIHYGSQTVSKVLITELEEPILEEEGKVFFTTIDKAPLCSLDWGRKASPERT